MRSIVGTMVQAITLQTGGVDYTEALTDNYLKMKISGRHEANRWMDLSAESVIESPHESSIGSPNGEMLEGKPLRPVSSNGTAGSESEPLALLV
jgi:hypothetical protein